MEQSGTAFASSCPLVRLPSVRAPLSGSTVTCVDRIDGAPTPERRLPGPGVVGGLPLWLTINALRKGLRALRLPRPAAVVPLVEAGAQTRATQDGIADEVDAELAALRAAAQEQTQRREEAEALLDAARCELRRLETVVTRRTKDGAREHGAEYARENAAAKMMAELSRAQTRASAAESRGEAAAKELANLRRQLENKQTDGVLATALSSLMALTILTYLVHSPTGLKLLEGISHS
jgi:hypothetical protein